MKKKINICGKEYDVCTNALTMFLYKKEFKTGMLADINRLQELYIKQQKIDTEGKTEKEIEQEMGMAIMPELDNFIEVVFRIAYILIKTGNSNFMPFDSWLETVDNFSIEDSWIGEVTELAVSSFCGQGINGANATIKN